MISACDIRAGGVTGMRGKSSGARWNQRQSFEMHNILMGNGPPIQNETVRIASRVVLCPAQHCTVQ